MPFFIGSTNIESFLTLVDRRYNGQTCGRGWGIYDVKCGKCKTVYQTVRAVGTATMFICPLCGNYWHETWNWEQEQGCDGSWLEPVLVSGEGHITED